MILVDPLPRALDLICAAKTRARLEALDELVISQDAPMSDEIVERHLAEATLIVGQSDLPRARLERAKNLRAIFNVETNVLPNIDCCYGQEGGISVLTPSSAFVEAAAEASVSMAIDLCRGITTADRDFRAGRETYGLEGNVRSFPFTGAPVGIIGFGDLGSAFWQLIAPFRNRVAIYDPGLAGELVHAHDATPVSLQEVLRASRVVLVFAGATTENQGFIGKREFDWMQPGSAFFLMSRATVVDFTEFVSQVRSGRLLGATDVFPEEPVAADDPVRGVVGMLLSASRGRREGCVA